MKRSYGSRGFTFLEVVISASILMVLFGMAMQLFAGFSLNVRDQAANMDIESQVKKVERLLRSELTSVSAASVVLSDPNSAGFNTRLEWRPVVGYDSAGAVPILGELRRLEFVLDPGETRNNASQDGDRYIDEGSLTLRIDQNRSGTFDPSEPAVRVASPIASGIETYSAVPVCQNFSFQLGTGGSTTFQSQATTGFVQINLTFLGPHPGNATRVRLRDVSWRYAIRNP